LTCDTKKSPEKMADFFQQVGFSTSHTESQIDPFQKNYEEELNR
jgi:hypothetical protein